MTARATSRPRGSTAPPPAPARRVPIIPIVVAGVVFVLLVGVALAVAGDDGGSGSSDAPAFGPVTVEGAALPDFVKGSSDPAVGQAAPIVRGQDPAGAGVTVGEAGQPTLAVFLAHWCPHCRAELPLLVDLADAGQLDGVRLVAVLTGTNAEAPNFPPVAWVEDEGWTGDVLLDDDAFTAATAYGLTGYPFLVALDADGRVVERSSGELPAEDVLALATAAQGAG